MIGGWRLCLFAAAALASSCLNLRTVDESDGSVASARSGNGDAPAVTSGGGSARGCVDGSPCALPDMPCVVGAVECQGSVATCNPSDKHQANGIVCGKNSVCLDGTCSVCVSGDACEIQGKPCRVGTIECSGGKPQCTESANANDGKECGGGRVCRDGSCQDCAAGNPCVPPNPCHKGSLDCTGGTIKCNDLGESVAPGGACGANKVCSGAGECVGCTAGEPCDAKDPCKSGKIVCNSGAPVCVASDNAPSGTACGSSKVCSEGTCVTCSAGMVCVPPNPCHTGTLTCTAGLASCTDTGSNAPDGTSCGKNMVCSAGKCAACTEDAPCTPSNPCKIGKNSCATGSVVCTEVGNVQNGKGCGGTQVCVSGECKACDPGQRPTCDGTMLVECSASGSSSTSPCNRGCAAGACCSGSNEAVGGACAACGGQNQPCCKIANPECDTGLACQNNRCVVPCGDGPGQTCCENNVKPCQNNCKTMGNQTCKGGNYGNCSVKNVDCCGPEDCTNNCGKPGKRACNGGSLASTCSGNVQDTECCNGNHVKCSSGLVETCSGGKRTTTACKSQMCSGTSECAPCGTLGALCCPGSSPCGGGLICDPSPSRNKCVSCGQDSDPCCGDARTVPAGFFSPNRGNCTDGSTCTEHVGDGWSCD